MRDFKYCRLIFLSLLLALLTGCATTSYIQRPEVNAFIDRMSEKHHFDRDELCTLFNHVKCEPKILKIMQKPSEGKATPWHAYRAIFLTPEKIKEGASFWRKNATTLAKVEQQYGVPAEIIVAIIGVETQYGKNKGGFRVIDALSTLAFEYPRRADYFSGELEQYLLLTREQDLDPLEPVGSYAGAIGQPQFMPSSYRLYGIDFSGSHHADLCNNSADAIASVANYFKKHGWQTGEPVAVRANVTGNDYKKFMTKSLKPSFSLEELSQHGITPKGNMDCTQSISSCNEARTKSSSAVYKEVHEQRDECATKLQLERRRVPVIFMVFDDQYWLGFKNFHAITRYNSSRYYAMAVYQLSKAIVREREDQK